MTRFADEDHSYSREENYQQAFSIKSQKNILQNSASLATPNPQFSTTFTLFLALPIELRFLVWEFSLPGTRVFNVWGGNNLINGPTTKDSLTVNKSRSMPLQLHLCHESRAVAKAHYKYSFAPQLCTKGIWFDVKKDALKFESEKTLLNFLDTSKSVLQNAPLAPPRNLAADINLMISELRFLAIGADRGDYASTASHMLDFCKLEVVILQNMDMNLSPSHPKQCRSVLEKRWNRARAENAKETGILTSVPKFKWLGENQLRQLDEKAFMEV